MRAALPRFHSLLSIVLSAAMVLSVPLLMQEHPVFAADQKASLTPATFDFGHQEVGQASEYHIVNLNNDGTVDLQPPTNVTTSANFTASSDCSDPIGAGSSCQISVKFTPAESIRYDGWLSVTDEAGTQKTSLTGIGAVRTIGAPSQVSANPYIHGGVQVSFRPSPEDNSAIKSFTVAGDRGGSATAALTGDSGYNQEVGDLTSGTAYTFTVTAVHTDGSTGPPSLASNPVMAAATIAHNGPYCNDCGSFPAEGERLGGTQIVIKGYGLRGVKEVWVGANKAEPFSIDSNRQITALTPAQGGSPDATEVTVIDAAGQRAQTPFNYVDGSWLAAGRTGCDPNPQGYCGRAGHAATLLDRVECHQPAPSADYPCGHVLLIGGNASPNVEDSHPPLSSNQIYSPDAKTWSIAAPTLEAREKGHTVTLLPSGKVLVVGGLHHSCTFVPTITERCSPVQDGAEVYDPAAKSNQWTATGPMTTPRSGHTATLLAESGRVLVAGGSDGSKSIASAEVYDPVTNGWSSASSLDSCPASTMPSPCTGRESHTASALPDGNILIAGGELKTPAALPGGDNLNSGNLKATSQTLKSTEIYDPHTGGWTKAGDLITARYGHAVAPLPSLSGDGCKAGCGRVLVAGGRAGGPPFVYRDTAEVFDGGSRLWHTVASLSGPRYGHTATALPDGEVLLTNGGADLYHPAVDDGLGSWSRGASPDTCGSAPEGNPAFPPCQGRGGHTATLLADGTVLVAGGGGPTAELFVLDPSPFIAEVRPPSGPSQGGTEVTITGAGLYPLSGVTFGSVAAKKILLSTNHKIVAVTPHSPREPRRTSRWHGLTTVMAAGLERSSMGRDHGVLNHRLLRRAFCIPPRYCRDRTADRIVARFWSRAGSRVWLGPPHSKSLRIRWSRRNCSTRRRERRANGPRGEHLRTVRAAYPIQPPCSTVRRAAPPRVPPDIAARCS